MSVKCGNKILTIEGFSDDKMWLTIVNADGSPTKGLYVHLTIEELRALKKEVKDAIKSLGGK